MLTMPLTREVVIEFSRQMPSFPRVVSEIIATVDDPLGTLGALVESIQHDPVIAARVLAAANRASSAARREAPIDDIYAATALVGMSRVREITLISSMNGFVETLGANARYRQLWLHSIAVAVAVQEVSRYTDHMVALESALVAGLLHNIGQYWFFACAAADYSECTDAAK